jgi:2-dehydropantoate 2-reductase
MSKSKFWQTVKNIPVGEQPKFPEKFESKPMQIPPETAQEIPLTRRIHILGVGSIGTFIAHSLKCLPNPPPISLMMHKPEIYEVFKKRARVVRLINQKSQVNDEQTGYDVDLLEQDPETGFAHWRYIPDQPDIKKPATNPLVPEEILASGETYIYSLIVTVKGPATRVALLSIKHRLNADSTICLVQNGMGQVDELNKYVFTDPETRPTYVLGIISHGAHMASEFTVIHAGSGTTALGIVRDFDKYPLPPSSKESSQPPSPSTLPEEDRKRYYPTDTDLYSPLSSRFLLRTLTRSPILCCAPFPYLDLLQLQLEKLTINCLMNPLTALLNIPNGSLLDNSHISRSTRLLLAEISLVIRSLPELTSVPGIRARFAPERLESLYLGVAEKTAANSSSMREDMRKSKPTEIEYINGYIVKRGEELGIKCVLNYLLMQLVLAKNLDARMTQGKSGMPPKPYGVSRIEGEMGEDGSVVLEDVGTEERRG